MESLRHRITPSVGDVASTLARSAATPSPADAAATASPVSLAPSPFSSPLLISRLREAVQPTKERVREAWQRQKQKLQLTSKL